MYVAQAGKASGGTVETVKSGSGEEEERDCVWREGVDEERVESLRSPLVLVLVHVVIAATASAAVMLFEL